MTTPMTVETAEEIKARGAYYTPREVARFLCNWAIRAPRDVVLEPSCGDGVFLAHAARRLAELGAPNLSGLVGVEVEQAEAAKAAREVEGATIHNSSFFEIARTDLPGPAAAVVGNPPYIRYHGWTGDNRTAGIARARDQGVELSALSSSWAPFVIHAASFLNDDGRLGLVLPAELLHTDYAAPVRDYVTRRFSSVIVLAFDRMVFAEAQVDAILLLASNDADTGLQVIRVRDAAGLEPLGVRLQATLSPAAASAVPSAPGAQTARRRWNVHIDAEVARLYDELLSSADCRRLGDLASVDIGLVTGSNDYFLLDAEEVRTWRLPMTSLLSAVERPSDLQGLTVRPNEVRALFRPAADCVPAGPVAAYVEEGVRRRVHERYKPRHRSPWYVVPLPRVRPTAFLPYMSHEAPRIVVNTVASWSSNLVHGVATRGGIDPRVLSALSLSSLFELSAEIEARSYGGGVLKLETREAERILVPTVSQRQSEELIASFPKLDALVRAGHRDQARERVDAALDLEYSRLRDAARVLRTRRQGRKRAPGGL